MSHNTPNELKYTKEHEWISIEGDIASVGITDYAQSALGDIVFVELPEVNSQIDLGAPFGVVESVKSVSDLFSPLSGEVVEVNSTLEDAPESCNNSPYESWIIKLKISDNNQLSSLMSAEDYQKHCEEN
jgi:glycine cleavage system H protein